MQTRTNVVMVSSDVHKTEMVMNECRKQRFPLVIVDMGMDRQPSIPMGVTVTITKPKDGDYLTLANAANLGAVQAEADFLLLSDTTINSMTAIHHLMMAATRVPKLGAIHGDLGGTLGTRPCQWVPLFGTYYKFKALKLTGYFDGSIRDISLAAGEWATRAQKKGWVSVTTYCEKKELKSESPEILKSTPKRFLQEPEGMEARDQELLAPNLNNSQKPWTGSTISKPWQHKVTVSIPHHGTKLHQLKLAVDLWRSQTVKPMIEIRDTGSPTKLIPDLLSLEAPDLEVHFSRWRGHKNHFDFQALACDHAMSDCRTPYLVLTHNDLFLNHQTVLEELISQCDSNQPVVGYEMYPRKDFPYEGMVSHVLTIVHIETMDRIRASWNPRWLKTTNPLGGKEGRGWPSAEVAFNLMLRNAGIKPRIIGKELPMIRQKTTHFDHVGSYTTSSLYYSADKPRAEADLLSATVDAEQRLISWAGL